MECAAYTPGTPNESMPNQCTVSSFCSDDMTNVNPSEIAMEIDDIDQEILSVVEKLKKHGHANLLDVKNCPEATTPKKSSTKGAEDYTASDDSQNSTDIFSVPPTPPDARPCSVDSKFKTAYCSN